MAADGCWHAVQVPPKARAALHVHEAQLALLLRLVRTALQASGAASGSGYRLAAVDIIHQLTRCQVRASQCPLNVSTLFCYLSSHSFERCQ